MQGGSREGLRAVFEDEQSPEEDDAEDAGSDKAASEEDETPSRRNSKRNRQASPSSRKQNGNTELLQGVAEVGSQSNRHRSVVSANKSLAASAGSNQMANSGHCRSLLMPRQSVVEIRERLSEARMTQVLAQSTDAAEIETFEPTEDDEDKAAGVHTCGLLLDFVLRSGGIRKFHAFLEKTGESFTKYAKDALLRDEFHSVIWEDVVEFYKNYGAMEIDSGKGRRLGWPRTVVSDLLAPLLRIAKFKKECDALETEVSNWVMRYKMLNTHVHEYSELQMERQNRMDEFWHHYRSYSKLNELPSLPSIAARKQRQLPQLKPVKTRKSLCFDGEGQWKEIGFLDSESRPGSRAGSREHVRHGMRFTPGAVSSMKWEAKDPADGTRAAMRWEKAHGHKVHIREGTGIKDNPSESREVKRRLASSQSAPGLQNATKEAATIAARPLEVDPTETYVQACQRCLIVPTALPFVTGHSNKLLGAGKDLTDNDLRAIASIIREVECVDEVDLGGNPLLTESALVPFLERLFGVRVAPNLKGLILSDCRRMGKSGIDVISRLLTSSDGASNLKTLDLSRIQILPKCYTKLAGAIAQHESIENLRLSDTGLGRNAYIASQCITLLLSCRTLHHLEIGWNVFESDVFWEFGRVLVEKKRLRSLAIPNCSSAFGDVNTPPPITFFLEWLSDDTMLKELDVSLNRLGFRSMLILEDVLEFHRGLYKLDISHNPLGVLGMRSVLRLLSTATSGLTQFNSTGSYAGSEMRAQTFNITNCGGRYSLELERPYHRTILRMLYKSCERMKQSAEFIFTNLQYSKSGWVHATKNSQGIYQVPTQGKLDFVFNIKVAIDSFFKGVADYDYCSFIEKHAEFAKVRPAFKKVIPLLGCWALLDGQTIEQNVFLNALAKDFQLTAAHLETLVEKSKAFKSEIIHRILPCITGGEAMLNVSMLLFPNLGEFLKKHQEMRVFLDFNIQSPTGHYKFLLESCTDYAVAQNLMLLDQWEMVLDQKLQRKDTSQRGNGSHIRNEHYRGKPLWHEFYRIGDWTLPEIDVLEFDYISGKRCSPDVPVVNERTFNNMLVSLFDSGCSPTSKLQVLRTVSHHIFLRATQMRSLLGSFRSEETRAEAFVTFYLQVVDMWNAKVFRVRFSDEGEVRKLQERLGYATFFPFLQPENAKFDLRLQFHDQRLCLNVLQQLAIREGAGNIIGPQWIHADGIVDPLTMGVPSSWSRFESVPKEGIFTCTYICAPENRKFMIRTGLASTYGAFRMDVREEDVMWWTGLLEPPGDVLVFLEFLMGSGLEVEEAFVVIDGPDGNGEVNIGEFRDGIKRMKFKRFKGKDEKDRIDKIFRYLDPGGEGSVSKAEWGILRQLWNEYNLCVCEFVHFLLRTFGDLENAWLFLDADGSGSLDLDEWLTAVAEIGYFGPAQCVFGILDHSGDGDISLDEFQNLENYVDIK